PLFFFSAILLRPLRLCGRLFLRLLSYDVSIAPAPNQNSIFPDTARRAVRLGRHSAQLPCRRFCRLSRHVPRHGHTLGPRRARKTLFSELVYRLSRCETPETQVASC